MEHEEEALRKAAEMKELQERVRQKHQDIAALKQETPGPRGNSSPNWRWRSEQFHLRPHRPTETTGGAQAAHCTPWPGRPDSVGPASQHRARGGTHEQTTKRNTGPPGPRSNGVPATTKQGQ